jgi:CRISPR system Cascade subunit CasD
MNTKPGHLAIYLDAPLQSWGYQSKFERRTTLSYPTRSGILGMLCAALGCERDDTGSLASLARLVMQVLVFQQQSRLTDFHTVGGGWDKKRFPGNIVRKADGKPGQTVVTHREYLESARFGVVLSDGHGQLKEIADALRNPRWGIWLGRKACVPASPVFQGLFDTKDEAIEHLSGVAAREGRRPHKGGMKRVVFEVESFEEGTDTLMDLPVNFAERDFAPRRVAVDVPEEE